MTTLKFSKIVDFAALYGLQDEATIYIRDIFKMTALEKDTAKIKWQHDFGDDQVLLAKISFYENKDSLISFYTSNSEKKIIIFSVKKNTGDFEWQTELDSDSMQSFIKLIDRKLFCYAEFEGVFKTFEIDLGNGKIYNERVFDSNVNDILFDQSSIFLGSNGFFVENENKLSGNFKKGFQAGGKFFLLTKDKIFILKNLINADFSNYIILPEESNFYDFIGLNDKFLYIFERKLKKIIKINLDSQSMESVSLEDKKISNVLIKDLDIIFVSFDSSGEFCAFEVLDSKTLRRKEYITISGANLTRVLDSSNLILLGGTDSMYASG